MTVLVDMSYDETHAEACDRAQRLYNAACDLKEAAAQPQQQEAHVRLWERETFIEACEAAEIRRREEGL